MPGLPNKDVLCPPPLDEGQLDTCKPSPLLLALSDLVNVLVVQAPPCQHQRSLKMIVLHHLMDP